MAIENRISLKSMRKSPIVSIFFILQLSLTIANYLFVNVNENEYVI
ncbi:MAG: hypothetical protein JETT_0061 [Candidatus Jettenia ecosi]|uniref:Uncharacterized protein n=1 Tax=Candidatus Jettenia ecosi TaxID=2494326 RepID=A0A533QSK0_9BACT|nr:MAG: hypothetical protein JETT_0061 [Candidatus Jettenia ecosi]